MNLPPRRLAHLKTFHIIGIAKKNFHDILFYIITKFTHSAETEEFWFLMIVHNICLVVYIFHYFLFTDRKSKCKSILFMCSLNDRKKSVCGCICASVVECVRKREYVQVCSFACNCK